MTPSRRLKVFQARFGFHESVVAAPSQAAALRAWGTHQNLFAEGQAAIATDAQAVKAALAHPGVPLRRAAGSADPFQLEPTGLPKVPKAPKKPPAKAGRSERAATAPAAATAPDRSLLDAAEATVRKIDQDRQREEADFQRRQDALDAERAQARRAYAEARRSASAEVAAARKAYRKAGGGS